MAGRAASPPVLQKMAFEAFVPWLQTWGNPRLGASGNRRGPLPCFVKSSLGRLLVLWGADFTFSNRCAETVFSLYQRAQPELVADEPRSRLAVRLQKDTTKQRMAFIPTKKVRGHFFGLSVQEHPCYVSCAGEIAPCGS